MALSDEVKKYDRTAYKGHDIDSGLDASLFFHNRKNKDAFENSVESYLESLSVLDSPIGRITSRDQIINPNELIDTSMYANNVQGRALMENDLQRARTYAEQQEAAYQEWYDSPEQQAIRQRAAGQNPNLMEYSGGESSDTTPQNGSPMAGLPTNGEIAVNVATGISSVISSLSSVANLATAFSTLPLIAQQSKNAKSLGKQLDLQNEILGLESRSNLGVLLANDISDLLATDMQRHLDSESSEPFDEESWFNDDSNFSSLDSIYGSHPYYKSELAKQRRAVLSHRQRAASMQSNLASSNWSLGQIIGDSRYSSDQKLTMIQLRPYIDACVAADSAEVSLRSTLARIRDRYSTSIDVDLAAQAFNSRNESDLSFYGYNLDYYSTAQGDLVAAYEQFLRDSSKAGVSLQSAINQGYLDMFNSDPSGESGWKAAYLFGSNGGSSWKEAFLIRHNDKFNALVDSEIVTAEANGDYANLIALGSALSNFISAPSYTEAIDVMFVSHYTGILDKIEKILKKQGYDTAVFK